MAETRSPFVSFLHRSSSRDSGISWWGERPTWVRHVIYWVIALALLSATALDDEAGEVPETTDDLALLLWMMIVFLIIAVMTLVYTLKEWEEVGVVRTASRSMVLFTFVLGLTAAALFYMRGSGVEITQCRVAGEQEVCSGQASPQESVGMLAWHAADVVPILRITGSFEWDRPARSDSAFVGAAIMIIRLWVAVGVLAIIKRMWDKWGPSRSADSTPG
jgi:hypothetical protein